MPGFVEIIRMEYKIIISTAAENDTKEAYLYYEQEQPALGERFLTELTEFYLKLQQHPTYYSFVSGEKTIRAVSLKIFPFKIIFQIEGQEIYVFAIHHFRKLPNQFLKRF